MTKVVINVCCGGFSLSDAAVERGREISGDPGWGVWRAREVSRTDPVLVKVVEELGSRADGPNAELSIEEVPAGTPYRITDHDGLETLEIPDTIDWSIA